MVHYSVKQLSKLAGVSVRTLHLYDEVGLLKPSLRTRTGYRKYGEKELLRLQQILFYKELDIPLKTIAIIIDDTSFDLLNALKYHKTMLKEKKIRIHTLLANVNKTIKHLKEGGNMLTPEELYQGFSKEDAENYRNQAIIKYGLEAVETSEGSLKKLNKDQFAYLKAEQKEIAETLFALKEENPASRKVQKEIALHYLNIRKFWGKEHVKDNQAEAYKGLGKLYVSDDRFCMVGGKPQPEYALFLCNAIEHYAATNLV